MLDKITILCFAASYSVALGLEATRFWFRSGVRGVLLLGFSAAGLLAHSMYLAALWTRSGVTPLFSEYDWYLSAAWILAVIYFYFLCVRPKNSLGLFFLPLVLALVSVANFLANQEPFAKPEGTRILNIAHGVFLLLGTVTVLFGFAAGVMYLVQASRLKHKRPPRQGLQLPSLEWLAKANTRALHISLVLVLGGFVSGLVLSNLRHNEIHWSDPIVLVSTGMVGWMLISSLFSLFYKPARVGQKVAYLTMASFVFLVLTLAAFLYDTRHGGTDRSDNGQTNSSARLAPAVVESAGATGKRSLPVSALAGSSKELRIRSLEAQIPGAERQLAAARTGRLRLPVAPNATSQTNAVATNTAPHVNAVARFRVGNIESSYSETPNSTTLTFLHSTQRQETWLRQLCPLGPTAEFAAIKQSSTRGGRP